MRVGPLLCSVTGEGSDIEDVRLDAGFIFPLAADLVSTVFGHDHAWPATGEHHMVTGVDFRESRGSVTQYQVFSFEGSGFHLDSVNCTPT